MMRHRQPPLSLNYNFYFGSATGNTFLITESPLKKIKGVLINELKDKSIDSGLVIKKIKNNFYKMHVIEKDGSESAFCGNGARVIAHYLYEQHGIELARLQIENNDEGILLGKKGSGYFVKCGQPEILPPLSTNEYTFQKFIVCGEPHLITDNFFDPDKLKSFFNLFNKHRSINVSCINNNNILTYERGVDAITQSCGSACIAATQYMLMRRCYIYDKNKMPWHCPGGTNFVDIKTFDLSGETFLEERLINKKLSFR